MDHWYCQCVVLITSIALGTVGQGRLLSYVHVIYKSDANISSKFVEDFIKQVRRAQRPIVYIWFGTCELTERCLHHFYI
jgi:hypothetical protein